jgi:putative acetyltransferase
MADPPPTSVAAPAGLTAVAVRPCDPVSPAALALLQASDAYFGALYPAESNHLVDPAALQQSGTLFVGAYLGERLLGCGAVRILADDGRYGEIKRLFVPHAHRGRGAAKAIMDYLERHLVDQGIAHARLETGIHQPEAIGLYHRLGYRQRPAFGAYRPDPLSLFMEKRLNA